MKATLLRGIVLAVSCGIAVLAMPSCATNGSEGTDSNTHWLAGCNTDLDCGSLQCVCGVCTKRCDTATACNALTGATCAVSAACASEDPPVCVAACSNDTDCTALAPSGVTLACRSHQCLPATAPTGGAPVPCLPTTNDGDPCGSADATCERPCIQGYAGRLYCSDGHWLAGLGLFPCGADAGPSSSDAGIRHGGAADSGGSVVDAASIPEVGDTGPHTSLLRGNPPPCSVNTDCELTPRTCCGSCDTPDQVVAVAKGSAGAYRASVCLPTVNCAACVPREGTVEAVCGAGGRCEATSIRTFVPCLRDADCTLRAKNCCECSGTEDPTGLVSVNSSFVNAYETAFCAASDRCDCLPHYPTWVHARCNLSEGSCIVAVDSDAGL